MVLKLTLVELLTGQVAMSLRFHHQQPHVVAHLLDSL